MANDFTLSTCQDFELSACQNRESGGNLLLTMKVVCFFTTQPMSKIAGIIDLINANANAIMATLEFYDNVPVMLGTQDTWAYYYNLDINPTFVLPYGVYFQNAALGLLNGYSYNDDISGYWSLPMTDEGGPPEFSTLAVAQAAMDSAQKMIQLVWWFYSGPPGSTMVATITSFSIDGTQTVVSTATLTSVAPPADLCTPGYGSVFKLPIPAYVAPVYTSFSAYGVTYWHVTWDRSNAFPGFINAQEVNADADSLYWIHGDYTGAGGSGNPNAGM